jgi:hypothetical protein
VYELDIGITAQLAKNRRGFDGSVAKTIELAEEGDAADFGHERTR